MESMPCEVKQIDKTVQVFLIQALLILSRKARSWPLSSHHSIVILQMTPAFPAQGWNFQSYNYSIYCIPWLPFATFNWKSTKKQTHHQCFFTTHPPSLQPNQKISSLVISHGSPTPPRQVTLLLMNSIANEALPLFLDQIVPSGGLEKKPPRKQR